MPEQPNSDGSDMGATSYAKEALKQIGECRLPPTPSVYEVFFTHFQGVNNELSDELSMRLDNPTSLTLERVDALHSQFCSPASGEDEAELAMRLSDGVADFKAIVADQKEAGGAYAERLETANKALGTADPREMSRVASTLTADTKEMSSQLAAMQRRVAAAEQQVDSLQTDLLAAQSLLMTDHLTGLQNRRFYEAALKQMIRDLKHSSSETVPYLALIDCDKFKKINDTFGHPVGDDVIRLLGATLNGVEGTLHAARLGGDEFAVFCKFASLAEVEQFADAIRTAVRERRIINQATGETLTRFSLSIGVARVRASDDEDSWHSRADKMLYQAKSLGGDRAVVEKSQGT
ncbi:MAG: diguanylate cyclase [Planctomycetota bacterium]